MKEFEKGIYETTNYAQFRLMPAGRNRSINRHNVEDKIKSIKRFGQLVPIEVNKNYEIIDGQHRFLACEELGIPVVYRFAREISTDELAEMNRATARWTSKDYIYTMAAGGDSTHRYLKCLIEEFPDFGPACIERALCKSLTPSNISGVHVDAYEYEHARKVLSDVRPLWNVIKMEDNITQLHLRVIIRILTLDVVDCDFVVANLLRNDNYKTLKPFSREEDIVQNIEATCNKGLRNKIYFFSAYKDALGKIRTKNLPRFRNANREVMK